ncbi:heterokaryon incompatibility protein-domain-containing protein [Phaeosphaeriaceae sp. PMI808]|nr:heterokaryon incompatibility protein-domain-containing protein [Phaeosphaeriaceae sp. PMI808]
MPRPQLIEIESSGVNRTLLRVCVDPDSEGTHMGIPVGLPTLIDHDSALLPFLLQKWLDDCDKNHKHDANFSEDNELPTRVIFVGASDTPETLRIWETNGARGRYIALFHRWGKGDEDFSTTKSNFKTRCQGMKLDQFPRTFQDAVRVTRMLGIQYLWIDSLCIIQKENEYDDGLDWRHESKRMETVFASVYFTIAATSAESSQDGFLGRRRSGKGFVELWGPLNVYISADTEDFHYDVETADLNRRGWVFQERALSPRTLHFTAAQIYWECGRSNWLGDSQFPTGALRLNESLRDSMFQFIFEKYSGLALSRESDRPIAISGLQDRLAAFYSTDFTSGVARKFCHRSLLWKSSRNKWMKPIHFPDGSDKVPSWSWMSCTGQISYGKLRQDVVYKEVEICPMTSRLKAPLARIIQHRLRPTKETSYKIRSRSGALIGWLQCDQEDENDMEALKCICIMGSKHEYAWKEYAEVR